MVIFNNSETEEINNINNKSKDILMQKINDVNDGLFSLCLINELNMKHLLYTLKFGLCSYIVIYLIGNNISVIYFLMFMISSFIIRLIAGIINWIFLRKNINKIKNYVLNFNFNDDFSFYKTDDVLNYKKNIMFLMEILIKINILSIGGIYEKN